MNAARATVSAVVVCLLMAVAVSAEEEIKGTSFFGQDWLKALISIEISADGKTGKPIGSGVPRSDAGEPHRRCYREACRFRQEREPAR